MEQALNFFFIHNLNSVITFIVGLVALVVYLLQKRDTKIKAARVILSEIRNAERSIVDVSGLLARNANDFPSILPTNSWKKYSYLFATELSQDELEAINHFYGICEKLEDLVKRDNSYFWLTAEYRAQVVQNKLADAVEKASSAKTFEVDQKKLENFLKIILSYANHYYSYSPSKTIISMKATIESIQVLSTSSIGTKLRKIARIK